MGPHRPGRPGPTPTSVSLTQSLYAPKSFAYHGEQRVGNFIACRLTGARRQLSWLMMRAYRKQLHILTFSASPACELWGFAVANKYADVTDALRTSEVRIRTNAAEALGDQIGAAAPGHDIPRAPVTNVELSDQLVATPDAKD